MPRTSNVPRQTQTAAPTAFSDLPGISEFAGWEVFRRIVILLWDSHWTAERLRLMLLLATFLWDTPVRLRIHFVHLTFFSPIFYNLAFPCCRRRMCGNQNELNRCKIYSLFFLKKKKMQSLVPPSIRLVALWSVSFFERTRPHIRPHSQ